MLDFTQIPDKVSNNQHVVIIHSLMRQLEFPKGTTIEQTKDTMKVTLQDIPFPTSSQEKPLMSTMTAEYQKSDIVAISIFTRNLVQAPV